MVLAKKRELKKKNKRTEILYDVLISVWFGLLVLMSFTGIKDKSKKKKYCTCNKNICFSVSIITINMKYNNILKDI